jgi:hypothetical protein
MCIPPGYPQDEQPQIQLFCEWLSVQQIRSLQQHLAGLWREQGPGLPIGFTWIDWLQNEALSFLGWQDAFVLFEPAGTAMEHVSSSSRPSASVAGLDSPAQPASCSEENGRADHSIGKDLEGAAHLEQDRASTSEETCHHGFARSESLTEVADTASDLSSTFINPEVLCARLIGYDAVRNAEIYKEVGWL